ncbi:MAG: hypothetical protein AAFP81_11705 [Pseudomonadota bacterium]
MYSDPQLSIAFMLLVAVLGVFALRGIVNGRAIFEYPTLIAFLGLAWIVPQGIQLETSLESSYAGEGFWLYVIGCFLFLVLGFAIGRRVQLKRLTRGSNPGPARFDNHKLLAAALALTLVGAIAGYQIRGIDTSGMGGQWTGVITMWVLLAKANGFGLCLAVLVFARTGSLIALLIGVFAALPIISSAFIGVRREAIFDLAVLTGGAWYLSKKKFPPRLLVLVAVIGGTVLLNTVGTIRAQVRSGETSLVSILTEPETYNQFDFFDVDNTSSEVGLAQYDYWYANQTGNWELGANHWNQLVHQYVPAFAFGREFKDSLKFSTLSTRLSTGQEEGLDSLGSTRTGFSDSYRGFGGFGVLVFAAIGCFFGALYANSFIGVISGQYFYLVLLAEGLKAVTHSTSAFVAALPFTIILSLFVLAQARSSKKLPKRMRVKE